MFNAKQEHKCRPQKARRIGRADSPKRPAPPVSQDLWTNPDGSRVTDAAVLEKLPPQGQVWFAHPVYFMHRMNEAGLLADQEHVAAMKRVQDKVMALKCLERGNVGMYDTKGYISPDQTYCNHAVFLTIEALDGNFGQFIGYPELYERLTPPDDLQRLKQSPLKERLRNYPYRISNLWCDILREQAMYSERTGICGIGPEEAQEKANMGYVVIGSWKNTNIGEGSRSPHFATVYPNDAAYNSEKGPLVANVGVRNDIMAAKDSKSFGEGIFNAVEWYYNKNQAFDEMYGSIDKLS